MIEIRPATEEDAKYVGANLRPADRVEGTIATGKDPVQVVVDSWRASARSYAVFPAGSSAPCAIYGTAPTPARPDLGIAWMLCTPEVTRVARGILQEAPEQLHALLQDYAGGLQALAWSGNHLHIRWCRRLGFTEVGRVSHNDETFIHLFRSNSSV